MIDAAAVDGHAAGDGTIYYNYNVMNNRTSRAPSHDSSWLSPGLTHCWPGGDAVDARGGRRSGLEGVRSGQSGQSPVERSSGWHCRVMELCPVTCRHVVVSCPLSQLAL